MPLNFTAIDFETANGASASPCAVGLVKVAEGKIVDTFSTLIKPPYPNDWFATGNIGVHGIHPQDVVDAPTWAEALEEMLGFIGSDDLIAHNAGFDMGVLKASAALIEYELPDLRYGCSLVMARKTYNLDSYRLNQVAYAIGHEEFDHHDALADSDACARIVIHMADRHGVSSLDELAKLTNHKIKSLRPESA
jgi:DNA polymerase-3 subunit epsilon